MRKHFSEYFRPTVEETKLLWEEAVFIFDTNVLLNLYRMSQETSLAIREILKKLKGRLFLPHQVAVEFFRHREEEIAKQVNAFERVRQSLKKIPDEFKKDISRHPCIPITAITEALKRCVDKQIAIVNRSQQANQLNFLTQDDSILIELDDLFAGSSEGPYSDADEAALNKKVEDRFQQNLPPCFIPSGGKASAPPTTNSHSGDGRVWFQIVRYTETAKKHIIFVTGDEKTNWWRTAKLGSQDHVVGPHFELIRDVESASGKRFMMYTQEEFLSQASKYLGVPEQTQAIDEVRQILERDSMEKGFDLLDETKSSPEELERLGETEYDLKGDILVKDTGWFDEPKSNPHKESKNQQEVEPNEEVD